jgi:uncharacterized protein (TIRG00374 family)
MSSELFTELPPDRAETLHVSMLRRGLLHAALATGLFVLVGGVALWWLGPEQLLATAGAVSAKTVLACLGLALINYGLRAARWVLVARSIGIEVSFLRQSLVYVAGFALTITPGKLGEAVRLWLLRRGDGVSYTASVPLLVCDRLFDMVGITALALAGAALTSQQVGVTMAASAASLVLLLVLAWPRMFLRLLDATERGVRRFPKGFAALRSMVVALSRVGRAGVIVPALVMSALGWFAECIVLFLVLRNLGAPISAGESVLAFSLSTIAGGVSMLPGGLGSAELGLLGLLRLFGVGADTAAVATLATRVATLWFAVALGLLVLPFALRRRPEPRVSDVSRAPA